jgi:hypothetical protein
LPALGGLAAVQALSPVTSAMPMARWTAAAGTKSLAYRFGGREVGKDADTGQMIFARHVLWESNTSMSSLPRRIAGGPR